MVEATPLTPGLILPVGTQVVTRGEPIGAPGDPGRPRGSVGVVVRSPLDNAQPYRVRFLDGTEADLRRTAFAIRKHAQRAALRDTDATRAALREYVIYRCVVGSRAYGLDEPGSDTDRRGIYLPPAELHWSLSGVPGHL